MAGMDGVTENNVLVVPLDLVKYDQHQAALDTVLHHFGEVSIVIIVVSTIFIGG